MIRAENTFSVVYLLKHGDLALVVRMVDNAVHQINLYPEDSAIFIGFNYFYLLDIDLSTR